MTWPNKNKGSIEVDNCVSLCVYKWTMKSGRTLCRPYVSNLPKSLVVTKSVMSVEVYSVILACFKLLSILLFSLETNVVKLTSACANIEKAGWVVTQITSNSDLFCNHDLLISHCTENLLYLLLEP